nr:hypothetical protein [Tanacetum cinerariifolium]
MKPKDTLSSCSDSDEQDMQQMLKRTKILKGSCLNGLSALKSNFTWKHVQGITQSKFKRAFSHIFGEDVDTFIRTFSRNMDTLEQQLTKETIIESNCQNAFKVLKTHFEKIFTSMLIKPSRLDGTIQKRLDDKKLQIQECTVQEDKASDAISEDKAQEHCMVSYRLLHSHLKLLSNNDLKGTRTEYGFKRAIVTFFGQDLETFTSTMFLNIDQLEKQLDNKEFQEIGSMASFKDTSNRSGNDAHADDADIRPIYDEEPMAEENENLKRHYKELSDSIKTTRAKTIEHTTSLIAQNAEFKAQLQEKGFAVATLKNKLRKLTRNNVNTKFARTSILGKPVLQPHRNQSVVVVRQPTAFKSERPRISKQRFASQVDVSNDLPKPVTTHYLPRDRGSAFAKPHHMISPSSSRYSSNDKVHNHYLEEAKKKTQESNRNSKLSVIPSTRSQSTANVGLKWVPIGKLFTSNTTKVDSEPTNGSNEDITNQYECEQTLDVSAVMTSDHNSSELRIHDHNNEPSSSKLVPKVVSSAVTTALSKQELDLLFCPLYDEFFTLDERLENYKKNKAVFTKKINVLNLEVKLRDKVLAKYITNLEKAKKVRDELKLTLEKLQNSSKSLNTLPNSQVSDKSKAGLGYKELIPESFVNSSELLEKQNNRSTKGYHEVPPPLTWNYIPLKRDLRLIDEHFESESVDVSTVSSSADKTVKTVDIRVCSAQRNLNLL